MALNDLFTKTEDGWVDQAGEVYTSLPDLYAEIVSRWRSVKFGIQGHEYAVHTAQSVTAAILKEEFPNFDQVQAELKEMIDLEKELQAAMREIVVTHDKRLPGSTVQNRADVTINEEKAIKFILEAALPLSMLALSDEGKKLIKTSLTDRMSKYAGMFPSDVVQYGTKKSAVLREQELLNGDRKVNDDDDFSE